MELSFVEQEDVLQHLERMFRALMRRAMGIEIAPMPRLTWQQAMDLYGTDTVSYTHLDVYKRQTMGRVGKESVEINKQQAYFACCIVRLKAKAFLRAS